MKTLCFILLLTLPLSSFAIVDTRSAGYSKTFTDFTTKDQVIL